MSDLPQISEAEFEVMKIVWKHAPISTNEITDKLLQTTRTAIGEAVGINPAGNADWMNDFALSVNSETPSSIGYILFGIWLVGILAMIILIIKSSIRLQNLKKSALPLQNPEVRKLYHRCMKEMGINRNIHVYSTAFLKSPIIVGLLKPCIYLPIHLISDYNEYLLRNINVRISLSRNIICQKLAEFIPSLYSLV